MYQLPKNKVIYNYRYFLPYVPEWGLEELCEKRLEELINFCKQAEIDAVQFFVNILPGTYYMPAHNAEEQKHYAEWMKECVKPALNSINVSYQLNYQMLLGAFPYNGVDMRDEYSWDFMVNEYGEETLGCACPISPKFRNVMGGMLRLWASTEPDIIWIDDDFRMHNHGLTSKGLDYYCYCSNHIKGFAKYTGKEYTREEIVKAVLKPGMPNQLRRQWLDYLGITMTETAEWIRNQVHEVSPGTRLAQMTSVFDVHSVEGRNWRAFLNGLCGQYPPMIRPCSGLYTGTTVAIKQNSTTYRLIGQSIAVIEDELGEEIAEYGPELENTRFTTWCKSVSNTEYVLFLGQLMGCTQITMSLNDLEGSPIMEEPAIMPMLKRMKPCLQALAELILISWEPQGVTFLMDADLAYKVELNKAKLDEEVRMHDLTPSRVIESKLIEMGIPGKYMSSKKASKLEDIIILDGNTAYGPTDDELEAMLSKTVLMDGNAAQVLQKRGLGEYLGVKVGEKLNHGHTAEQYLDGILPGVYSCRAPHRAKEMYEIELNGAEATSYFIDSKFRHHVGSVIYENSRGGRVGIHSSIGNAPPEGLTDSHARKRWIHGVIRWLSKDKFIVLPDIPHYGRKNNDNLLIAFANLGTDILNEITFHFPDEKIFNEIKCLNQNGEWEKALYEISDYENGKKLVIFKELKTFEWLIINLMVEESIYDIQRKTI